MKHTQTPIMMLVLALLAANVHVNAYAHTGRWLDIGRQEDYETANEEIAKWQTEESP